MQGKTPVPVTTADAIAARAPAKINLHLGVGPVRSDGYHPLATIYQSLDLFEDVIVAPYHRLSIHVTGETDGVRVDEVPLDDSNIVCKAAMLLAAETGREPAAKIHIIKRIPIAAGLAGGSADAAATLVALNQLWGTKISRERLLQLAAELGSDVPFCLTGGVVAGGGRGEQLAEVLGADARLQWVLAVNSGSLSTPKVFKEFDRLSEGQDVAMPHLPAELIIALRHGNAKIIGQHLHNDLTAAALSLKPELAEMLDAGIAAGAVGAMVSGSGPTLAFLVADADQALNVSVELAACGAVALHRCSGPTEGAVLVPTKVVS